MPSFSYTHSGIIPYSLGLCRQTDTCAAAFEDHQSCLVMSVGFKASHTHITISFPCVQTGIYVAAFEDQQPYLAMWVGFMASHTHRFFFSCADRNVCSSL